MLMGKPVDEKKVAGSTKMLLKTMKIMDCHFLKDTDFISSNEISIADLMGLCEFTQLDMLGYDRVELSPTIVHWIERCKKYLQPNCDEVHAMLHRYVEKHHGKAKL